MKNENKVLLILIAILAVFIIGMILSPKSMGQNNLKWYRDYQESVEFKGWKESQPKKRIQAVKYAVETSKENAKEFKDNQKLIARIERIRQRIK